jgi:hypothetical protein
MHIERGKQLSKTKIMYIPNTSFYQPTKDTNTIEAPPPQFTPLITSLADDTTDDDDGPLTTQISKKPTKIPSPQ